MLDLSQESSSLFARYYLCYYNLQIVV